MNFAHQTDKFDVNVMFKLEVRLELSIQLFGLNQKVWDNKRLIDHDIAWI